MKKLYILFLLPILFISACKKEDNTPAWLVIDQVNFTTNEVTEGDDSHGITDVWVFMDNEALGVWSLPARIPILAEGSHDFTIYAGIKVNGISATRDRYPFYQKFETSLTLTKEQETTVVPDFIYNPNTQFQLIEDFESIGVDFEKDPASDTDMVVIDKITFPDIVEYGDNCGAVYLNTTDSLYKGVTNTDLNLPKGEDVYMEIDYMNTNSMVMGMIPENFGGSQEQPPYIQMNPQEEATMEWKKIYINLKDNVSFELNATSFEIYLVSVLDDGLSSGVVYLDNIKVLRFE